MSVSWALNWVPRGPTCRRMGRLQAVGPAYLAPGDGESADNRSSSSNPAELLRSCYNRHFDPTPASFQGWLSGRHARCVSQVVGAWEDVDHDFLRCYDYTASRTA
mgnify:CR=1 FL=1